MHILPFMIYTMDIAHPLPHFVSYPLIIHFDQKYGHSLHSTSELFNDWNNVLEIIDSERGSTGIGSGSGSIGVGSIGSPGVGFTLVFSI